MDTQTKDFIPDKREVKLRNGLVVTVTTPTLGWWYDFLMPKLKELQFNAIPPALQTKIIAEVKKGQLSGQTIGQMPVPLLDLLLGIVVHYIGHDAEWCKQNLDICDFVEILTAFVEVCDMQRFMSFFEKLSQYLPVGVLAGKGIMA